MGPARQQLRNQREVKSGGCGEELLLSWVVALFLSFDYGVLGCGCYRGLGSAVLLTGCSEADSNWLPSSCPSGPCQALPCLWGWMCAKVCPKFSETTCGSQTQSPEPWSSNYSLSYTLRGGAEIPSPWGTSVLPVLRPAAQK